MLPCYRDLQDSGAHVGGGQPGAALCQCGLLPCQEDQEEADLCRDEEESTEAKSALGDLENDHIDVQHLLHHNHDIACFPDGSLRFVNFKIHLQM